LTCWWRPLSSCCPYTTLFRSRIGYQPDEVARPLDEVLGHQVLPVAELLDGSQDSFSGLRADARPLLVVDHVGDGRDGDAGSFGRSEEHTSELQSRFDLVCRLL